MQFDPRLTIIRSKEVGTDFYDGVVKRIVSRPQQPNGLLFHFSGTFEDELFVVSVYRDLESATDTFADYTAPEIANEIRASGMARDVARHEFPVESLAIGDVDEFSGFRFTEPGEFRALLFLDESLHRDTYLNTTGTANFPDDWPSGLLFHVAGLVGDRWGIFDVWRGNIDPAPFYRDRIEAAIRARVPSVSPTVGERRHWIELHSLSVDLTEIGDNRRFLREPSQPSSAHGS
jgi:hypothetical protein